MKDIHQVSKKQAHHTQPVVALYWDYQNVSLHLDTAKKLLEFANSKGNLFYKNIYYNPHLQEQAMVKSAFESLSLNYCPVPCSLKNSADNQLMVDCLEHIDSNICPNVVILVSGDGDYVKLVNNLRHRHDLNLTVIIIAQVGNVKQKLLESANEFYFIDNLCSSAKLNTQLQRSRCYKEITYLEAIDYLIKAIKMLINQGKKTTFPSIDKLMRQICHQYQGVSSIRQINGNKFKNFTQFVNAAIKDGKVRRYNQELLLTDLDDLAA